MEIEVLLTPHVWLQAPPDVRRELAKSFGLVSTGTPRCVTQDGVTRIESDGFTIDDLRPLNAVTMQKALGYATVDDAADIHVLFAMCVDRAERKLRPPQEEKPEPEPSVSVTENESGELEVKTADKPPKAKKKV